MGRYLNWYLIELERNLKGRIPAAQLAETLNETEAHILDGAAELAPTCNHGEDPEELAVESFGSPGVVARGICDQADSLPYWQAAKAPMLWSFGLGLWCAIVSEPIVLLLGMFIGLLGFVVQCRKARRIVPVALAVSVAAAFLIAVPFLAGTRGGVGKPVYSGLPALGEVDWNRVKEIDRRLNLISGGLQTFMANSPPNTKTGYEWGAGYLVPAQSLLWAADRSGAPVSWAEAKRAWQADGWKLLTSLQSERRGATLPTVRYTVTQRTFTEAVRNWAGMVAGLAFIYWLFMVSLNGLVRLIPQRRSSQWLSKVISTH